MTAVIGIFNKSGAAIAADSAVTIGGGTKDRKIYNNANKIFTLSKFHPVSIMIYNSATFNGVPWEILIKQYRKRLGRNVFKTLREYENDFIQYIKSEISIIPASSQSERINALSEFIISNLLESVTEENVDELQKAANQSELFKKVRLYLRNKLSLQLQTATTKENLEDFKTYTQKQFLTHHGNDLDQLYKKYLSKLGLTQKNKNDIFKLIYLIIKKDYFLGPWTGLVFTGFGDEEIFPCCYSIRVGEVFDNRIRYYHEKDNDTVIGYKNNAAIRPFAQRDVIDLILTGIDSQVAQIMNDTFREFLNQFIEKLANLISPSNKKLAANVKNIKVEDIITSYDKEIQNIQMERHIIPLMASVSTLSKEDLAELAESLIYLTFLKRRMSLSEESVGGPVDVAIITKGDGFIWLKRKQYFKPELNPNFVSNYLNS